MPLDLKYTVENIGNIDNAIINIKPLTIIAGKNSTGKTFITKSLYTILDSVYKNHFLNNLIENYESLDISMNDFFENLSNPAKKDLLFMKFYENEIKKIQYLINYDFSKCSINEQNLIVNTNKNKFIKFKNEIESYFDKRLKETVKFKKYNNDINDIYKNLSQLVDSLDNHKQIIIDNIASELETGFKKNFQITNLKNLIKNGQKKSIKLELDNIGEVEIDQNATIGFRFDGTGIEKIQNVENIIFFDSPIYLKIKKALKDSNRSKFLFLGLNENKYLRGYPGYLDQLYSFTEKEYIDTPDFNDISKNIQSYISGKLDLTKNGDINYTDNQGDTIPLSLTAMGISNIGLIDLLLRNNVINKGSFLIMDEPEVHLHPEWQVLLAKTLYDIAKNGANVIIATHSLDFLKAFEVLLKNNSEEAEKNIAINKMPFDKNFSNKSEIEKVNIVLEDLSRPFYELYIQDL